MQFLQANGSLIFFGLALLFMIWMHRGGGHRSGMGGGCGMGHEDHGALERDLQQTGPPVQGAKANPATGQNQSLAPPTPADAALGATEEGVR